MKRSDTEAGITAQTDILKSVEALPTQIGGGVGGSSSSSANPEAGATNSGNAQEVSVRSSRNQHI